jgi:membrane protease YdiL (CAAX protease family)
LLDAFAPLNDQDMPQSAQCDSRSSKSVLKRYPVASFIVIAFAISWTVVFFSAATIVAGRWEQAGIVALVLVGQFGPTFAALIMTGQLQGKSGVTALLRSSVAVRQPLGLLVFAFLFYPALFALALAVSVLRGAPAPDFTAELAGGMALAFLPTLVLGMLFGGFSEEPGWRGFLLPRLQRRIGFLGASLAIGALWAVWHLDPEHVAVLWTQGWSAFLGLEGPILRAYLSETIAMSFVMAWLFNRSRGSLFLMILIHASSNASVTALQLLWDERPAIWSETVTAVQWGAALFFVLLSIWKHREYVVR